MKFSLSLLILFFGFNLSAQEYSEKFNSSVFVNQSIKYRALIQNQMDEVIPRILDEENIDEKTKREILDLGEEIVSLSLGQLDELIQLYEVAYGEGNKAVAVMERIRYLEIAYTYALNNYFSALYRFLKHKKKWGVGYAFKMHLIAQTKKNIEQIKNEEHVPLNFWDWLVRNAPTKDGFKYGIGIAIKNLTVTAPFAKLSEIAGNLKIEKVLKRRNEGRFIMKGYPLDESTLPDNAAVIVINNHEYSAIDGRTVHEINNLLGIDDRAILTTTTAYPHLQYVKSRDPNTFFIENSMFFRQIIRRMQSTAKKISFNIMPEGFVSLWSTQAPITVKHGAMRLARRLSYETDRPVYLIMAKTNPFRHMFGDEDFYIETLKPILVPKTKITSKDEWVERHRFFYENWINDERGEQIIDLANRSNLDELLIHPVTPGFDSQERKMACYFTFEAMGLTQSLND